MYAIRSYYVYVQDGMGGWRQEGKLEHADLPTGAGFGASVAGSTSARPRRPAQSPRLLRSHTGAVAAASSR